MTHHELARAIFAVIGIVATAWFFMWLWHELGICTNADSGPELDSQSTDGVYRCFECRNYYDGCEKTTWVYIENCPEEICPNCAPKHDRGMARVIKANRPQNIQVVWGAE